MVEIITRTENRPLSCVFTRTANSYITEWKAHNMLYDAFSFSDYLRERFGSADMDEDEVIAWDIAWQ